MGETDAIDGVFTAVKNSGLDAIEDGAGLAAALLGAGVALRLSVRWVKRAAGMAG